jgi:dTDP-4-dehydrorhamnose 3,5-epimerase-like enzyme
MQVKKESAHLGEIIIVTPEVFEDERGFFMESYRVGQFKTLGLPPPNIFRTIIHGRNKACYGGSISNTTSHGKL